MLNNAPFFVVLAVLAVLVFRGCVEREACGESTCESGSPTLLQGECVCLERARP